MNNYGEYVGEIEEYGNVVIIYVGWINKIDKW